jgi:hypothetical protein
MCASSVASAEMTSPRAESDLLIDWASCGKNKNQISIYLSECFHLAFSTSFWTHQTPRLVEKEQNTDLIKIEPK